MTSRKSERRTRLKRRRDALMERLDIDNAELESIIDEIAGKYSEVDAKREKARKLRVLIQAAIEEMRYIQDELRND